MATAGAEFAADTLARLADRVYGLCGGHIQPIWDALVDTDGTLVDTRDERAAVHAAHADAEVRGGLGVALVTAGPGFTNAVTGVATAAKTGVPLLVVTGAPPVPQFGRGALQDLPHRTLVEPLTVSDRTVFEAGRIQEALVEAATAALDEGGPAVVEIPTDVLRAESSWEYDRPTPTGPRLRTAAGSALDEAAAALGGADRPLAILGRGARDASEAVLAFLECANLPVLTTAGSNGVVPEDHDLCVPGARGSAMSDADAYLLLGKRLDFTLGYGSRAVLGDATFVQVDVDAGALRRNRTPEVAVHGTVGSAVEGLTERLDGPIGTADWVEDLQATHADRAARLAERKASDATPIHPYRVCGAIERALGDDAVVVCDGGDALSFGRIAIPATDPRGYLDPGPLGCIGVGLPFAIGASLARPAADVVCFSGDGALGFNLAELETAVRHEVDLTVVVANNAGWNIERYDQREHYGRELGSELTAVDYGAVARALGAEGWAVDDPDELDDAVARAVGTAGPAVVDVAVDPDAVSPDAANGLARVPDYQPLDAWDDLERAFRQS